MTVDQAIQLALQHHNAGQFQQAEQIYQQILQQIPNHPDALHLLGLLASQVGNQGAAAELISRAIQIDPKSAVYHSNLGEVLRKTGSLNQAEASCRRAVELGPDFPPAHANLGIVYYDQKRWRDAENSLRRAVELDANLESAVALPRAHALLEQSEFDQAFEQASRAISFAPGDARAHNCLGRALDGRKLVDQAETEFRKALELDPRHAEAMRNMGLIQRRRGHLQQAIEWWEKAVAAQPDHADANWNLALGLLALGDFERGWPLFEWRFKSDRTRHLLRDYPGPRWMGFDISGKTILLYGEQGFGDVIQFSRFIPQIAAKGARVIVQVPLELTELVKGIEGVASVIDDKDVLPAFDTHQTLLSLPLVLGTTLNTIPAKVPYIQINPHRRSQWAKRIVAPPGSLKIGLAWAGRPTHADDLQRSIAPATLAPLAKIPNTQFFSLQKNSAALPFEMIDLSEHLHDFLDTAAAISHLDLVIGIDSAVIHLAGAIGARVWTLLPFAPDFRWMLGRDDSPWYPTMKLFRQPSAGDWNSVLGQVVAQLSS